MIAFLKGQLVQKNAPIIVLNVSGVGYEIKIPMSSFYDLPEIHQEVQIFTHVIYREDAQNIFGFIREMERDFFRDLIKVNGVGPMMALTLMSGLSIETCIQTIQDSDVSKLIQLPGIGRRTAERLIVEMKPCADRWMDKIVPELPHVLGKLHDTIQISPEKSALQDAEAALISLGYKASDAQKALKLVQNESSESKASSEDMIRLALRQLVR